MKNFQFDSDILCDPRQAAFITIDFQNAFCDVKTEAKHALSVGLSRVRFFQSLQKKYSDAARNTNSLLPLFREAGASIIHVRMRTDDISKERDDFFEIETLTSDKFARKAKPNAFNGKEGTDPFFFSDVHRHLQKAGVSKLFLTGVHTDACVLRTAKGAIDNDYEVFVISDCTTERSNEHSRLIALQDMRDYGAEIMNAQQVRRALQLD